MPPHSPTWMSVYSEHCEAKCKVQEVCDMSFVSVFQEIFANVYLSSIDCVYLFLFCYFHDVGKVWLFVWVLKECSCKKQDSVAIVYGTPIGLIYDFPSRPGKTS